MAKVVYETAVEVGYDPCLVCNGLTAEKTFRAADILTLDLPRTIEHTSVEGMELKRVPRYLPEVEFLQYVLNDHHWRTALADGDAFFSVGGSSHCSHPLVRANVTYGSWTATPLWEDRTDRLKDSSILRRVRDRLSKPVLERIERAGYEHSEQIFVLSEYTATTIVERYEIERDRIEVVPYPIDTTTFTPDGPERPTKGRPTVLFVGRFTDPRKNVTFLLDAVDELRSSVPDVQLLLIGDELDDRIENHIDALGLADTVKCLGHIENESLPAFYRGADVFVIPSRQEGLAIVGLEAMACGTPVVSTCCGGPEEYVRDEDNGYMVGIDDTDTLADRLSRVLNDADLRETMGNRAVSTVETRFAADVIGERFVRAIKELG